MIVAFDYSLSCPCMCLSLDDNLSLMSGWENVYAITFLTSIKKYVSWFFGGKIIGYLHKEYKTEQERYHNISQHFIDVLDIMVVKKDSPVYIEDYSFGSKGRVFEIAENTAILKQKLWTRGHDIVTVPPTVIKKFATKSGAAKKEDMYNAFFAKTQVDLHTNVTPHKKLGSPVTDIVDAFFLAEYGHSLTKGYL